MIFPWARLSNPQLPLGNTFTLATHRKSPTPYLNVRRTFDSTPAALNCKWRGNDVRLTPRAE
eukprot:5968939-Pyramimonas_sp.AAC.1